MLVLDDTALPKKGSHSVGVAAQYASALGKTANCQTLVSTTLARGEVPVMVGLRLFLPDAGLSRPSVLSFTSMGNGKLRGCRCALPLPAGRSCSSG